MILHCYDCGQENHADRKYCQSCGSKLSRKCHVCDFENPVEARFCGGCGIDITTQNTPSALEAERRQLTVMFCDLVGSSELAGKFDPEDFRDFLRAFQQSIAEVTLKFGGHIAKYIGDGVLIYFGHPHAHEDDARRSVLAGLGIIEEIGKLNKKLKNSHEIQLNIRIGIHTGLVVIGQMGSGETREENAIVGETPNIAARIEKFATPNTVTISNNTKELTKGLFITEEKGFQELKGIAQTIELHEVISESPLSEFDVRAQQGLAPIVGRDKELNFLTQCWEQAKNGLGQVVWLSGEAGVGKSRIVNEFITNISHDEQHLRLYYCSSVHSNSAFFPIISHLKRLLNLDKKDSDENKLNNLENFLDSLALPLGDLTAVFAPLLGIKLDSQPENITPEKTKQIIIDSWYGLMLKMSAESPLLLVFEDTHWIDPSTQELIEILSSQLLPHRVLLLLTSRPGYHFSGEKNVPLQSLTLNHLDHVTSAQMIRQLGGKRSLPEELVEELVVKTDGIPLFIEEITKAIINSDYLKQTDKSYTLSAPISSLDIPNSLKDSLMARLDQLSAVKNVAQIAATIGRYFSTELLESLSLHSPKVIEDAIQKLLKARLIFISDELSRDHYQFSHALLQETAYQSLLKSTRKQYHGLIADSLISNFPYIVATEPEVVALHCMKGGKTELAVSYWLAAGKHANKTSSHNEAITHFSKGIDLLNRLPDSVERFKLEFQIQVRLIGPLIAAKSYASPDIEIAFTRALELSKDIDTSHEIFPVLHGRYAFFLVCGLINKAKVLVEEFHEIAKHQKVEFTDLELIGNRMHGALTFLSGDTKNAKKYLNKSIAVYNFEKHKNLVSIYGQDNNVVALTYLGLSQWHLGNISDSIALGKEAVNLSKRLSSANSTGISYFVGTAMPYALLDEPQKVLKICNQLIDVARSQEMPLWQTTGMLFKGWALVCLDQSEEGMEMLENGLASYNKMKVGLFRPLILLLYAQACLRLDLVVKGISALEESVELSNVGGEHWLDAETHRHLGELHLAKPNPNREKAREEFNTALQIAQEQSSLTQELRAAMSLLRFADDEGDIVKAESLLQRVYTEFDDTQNFKDLSQARELLGMT